MNLNWGAILLPVLCSFCSMIAVKNNVLHNHIRVIQELKGKFAREKHISPPRSKTTLTPTQSYLSIPSLSALVKKDWQNELVAHKDILDAMQKREDEFNDTHYVFYHGQNDIFRTLHDVLNNLYEMMYLQESLDRFYMMRVWYECLEKADMNKFIDEYEGKTPKVWSDQGGPLVEKLLSVNFSIFGNTNQWGECSLKAFTRNRSYFFNSIAPLLEDVFKKFGLNESYIKDICNLAATIATPEGTIYQIFVPKECIDDVAYVCHRWATPYRTPLVTADFNHKKQRHLHISPLIELYKKDAAAIGAIELDRLQARLLFSQDLLLNPASGVKMFRYTTISSKKQEQYDKQLKKIMNAIFNEWFASANHKEFMHKKVVARTPLNMLLRLMEKKV